MEDKRLFLGMEVLASWPDEMPAGRILLESDRHLTLVFLGNANLPRIQTLLSTLPAVPFKIGLSGYFDHPVFLPRMHPHTAGWHVQWFEEGENFAHFQKEIVFWLKKKGLSLRKENDEFFPHVTIARSPFRIHEWKQAFQKRPFFLGNLHLCESLGYSRYEVCWTYPILAPFEEKEHTADITFLIRGKTMRQLHLHAQLALSFHSPLFLDYFSFEPVEDLQEIIQSLNRMIGRMDQKQGSPFKAVSYHGTVVRGNTLEWEMLVDV